MAHSKFTVEVLTPEGEVFNDEVEMISTKTSVGSIGVLAHHAPVLAMLDPAELRLYRSDSDIVRFAQSEGYMQVADNHALLLVEEAHEPGSLDAGQLRERLQQAESDLDSAGTTPSGVAWPSATSAAMRRFWRSPKVRPRPSGRRSRPRPAGVLIGASSAPRTLRRLYV
jgi:F-type H+-transporting ATPase subunit epsilon